MGTGEHKKKAPTSVRIGIVSVSTTRKKAQDESGHWMADCARRKGHRVVFHQMVGDHAEKIASTVQQALEDHAPETILVTGGTGVSPADVTIEALRPLFDKELGAFAALFASLSHAEIGSAAMMSRAMAGTIRQTAVFCMPGSLKACQLACERLIFPELGHLAAHLRQNA